jgi:hypothetical protein
LSSTESSTASRQEWWFRRLSAIGFESYDAYLRSPGWRKRRAGVLNAARGMCACGAPATQVHHRTYARLGHERPSDLHAVCRACHEKIHGFVSQGSALEAATMAVLEGPGWDRPARYGRRGSKNGGEKERRRAKRARKKARKREQRAKVAARAERDAELRIAEARKGRARTAALDETARRIEALQPQRPVQPRKNLTKAERRLKRKDPTFEPNRPPVGGGLPVKKVRAAKPSSTTETSRPAGAPGSHRSSSRSSTA